MPSRRRLRRAIPVALPLALLAGGCGMRLYRATTQQTAALEPAAQAALGELGDTVVAAATAWQVARREREIMAVRAAAVADKQDVPQSLAAWAEHVMLAERKALREDGERDYAYCRARYDALTAVLEREDAYARARLRAAKAAETETRFAYEVAELELGRARAAYVLDAPGVLKEDRAKKLALWDKFLARARKRGQTALVERRQAEVRAEDQRKAWLGVVYEFRRRFDRPCAADWALPERGAAAAAPDAAVRDAAVDDSPLAEEANPPPPATAPEASPRWQPSL